MVGNPKGKGERAKKVMNGAKVATEGRFDEIEGGEGERGPGELACIIPQQRREGFRRVELKVSRTVGVVGFWGCCLEGGTSIDAHRRRISASPGSYDARYAHPLT